MQMHKKSLPQHMIREITNLNNNDEEKVFHNSPYLMLPMNGKIEQKSAYTEPNNPSHNNYLELKENLQSILAGMTDDDVILEMSSNPIKLKYLKFFEEKNIINENTMLFILNFFNDKQNKQNKKIFCSQIVLVRISRAKTGLFEYKFFGNKERKIPENFEEYKFFLYVIQINNHWALGFIDTVTQSCKIYTLCKQVEENFPSILKKIHQNFLNFSIEEFILDESFSQNNEKDESLNTCSLIMNFILISLYVHEQIPNSPKPIAPHVLKENQKKILKVFYGYIKKYLDPNPKPSPLLQRKSILISENRNITNHKNKNGNLSSALLEIKHQKSDYEKGKSMNLPVSVLKKSFLKTPQLQEKKGPKQVLSALKKKSKYFSDKGALPILKQNSKTDSSDSFSSQQEKKNVILTKNDIMPIMNDVKKKIIDEILGKMQGKNSEDHFQQKKLAKSRAENFANYQNYLNYYYYNNPALYTQLIDEYNKRYYKYLLNTFGLPDKDYEKSESLELINGKDYQKKSIFI